MPIDIRFDIPALIIFIGIVLGFLQSFFFIKNSKKQKEGNIFMGLFLLTFTVSMLEGWLNYTGLIFRVLHLTNFSEPTNFIIAPLLYLFVSRQLGEKKSNYEWLHYVPFVFWCVYCVFFFMQSADFKYNSNIFALRFDIEPLKISYDSSDNPLGIRDYVNDLTIVHIFIYIVLVIKKLVAKSKSLGESIFKTSNATLHSLRNSVFHFTVLFVLLIVVKIIFKDDFGDYLLYIYLTFLLLISMMQIMNSSSYFDQPSSFLEFPNLKYQKSSLTKQDKDVIVNQIKKQMVDYKFYENNLASLSNLSSAINHSKHHVSQAINEDLNMTFFELLAHYRIEAAKRILASEEGKKLTIEDIAEQVGYNSKSAFNVSFKKLTNLTPSQFRDTN